MWVEKNGKTWRIREELAGKKVDLRTGFTSKTAANAALVALQAEALRGESLVPRGGRITLTAFLDTWWPRYVKTLKPTAERSEGARVECHIRPMLGHLTLDDIDAITVEVWVDMLEAGEGSFRAGSKRSRKPLSPKTVANVHGLLFQIMRAAIKAKLIRTNPCVGTPLPRREPKEMRVLTDPEIARLITHIPPHWRPLVLLLMGTGLRWGEAIGLKVGRVDLLARKPKLLVVEQLQELSGSGELIWLSPKSARSRRTVTFIQQIALALVPLVAGKGADDVVFRAPGGGYVRTRNFRRGWVQWTKAAGLDGFRIHDCRHTHAAILLSAGHTLEQVSRRLGHSSVAVTDVIYGHLRPGHDDAMLDSLAEALGGVDLEAQVAKELADV